MRNKAILIIAALILIAAALHVYFLREHAWGCILWDADEAYFIVQVVRTGYHVSYLGCPWFFAKEYFGAVESPLDSYAALVIIRVTSSGIERHVVKLADREEGGAGSDPDRFTPIEGRIYANCPTLNGLCRWVGDHFEGVTQEERQRLGGSDRLTKADFDNDKNGWSRRQFGAGPNDRRFTIEVGDKFRLTVMNSGVPGTKNGSVSIDLLRPGQDSQRIADFDARQAGGMVSKTTYQRAFHDGKPSR